MDIYKTKNIFLQIFQNEEKSETALKNGNIVMKRKRFRKRYSKYKIIFLNIVFKLQCLFYKERYSFIQIFTQYEPVFFIASFK